MVIKGQALGGHGGYGAVILDDCNFHECVNLGDFRAPFSIFPFVEQQSPSRIEISIKVRADIPEQNYGGNVQVSCVLPKSTATCSIDMGSSDMVQGGGAK